MGLPYLFPSCCGCWLLKAHTCFLFWKTAIDWQLLPCPQMSWKLLILLGTGLGQWLTDVWIITAHPPCLWAGQTLRGNFHSKVPCGIRLGLDWFEATSCSSSSPCHPTSLTPLHVSSKNIPSIIYLHRSPCLSLCFQRSSSKTNGMCTCYFYRFQRYCPIILQSLYQFRLFLTM